MISRTSSRASSSVVAAKSSRAASPRQAGPPSTLAPDVDAPRVDAPAEGAPDHGQALGVLGADRVEQLLAGLAAGLLVGPDQRHRARVLRGGGQRAGQELGHPRRVGPVLDGEHVAGVVPRRGGQQRRPPGGGPGIVEAGHVGHARPHGSLVSFVPVRSRMLDAARVFPPGSYSEAGPGWLPGPGGHGYAAGSFVPKHSALESVVPNMPETDVAAG